MAAYDTSTQSSVASATSLTFAHTCTGSNRILFVSATVNTSRTVSGITYNSVAMTSIGSKTDGGGPTTYLFYLIAPATGANNVVISATGSSGPIIGTAVSYTGARQSGQPDAFIVGSDTTTTLFSQALTSNKDGCWFVLTCRTGNGLAWTAGANTVVRQQPESTYLGAGGFIDSGTTKTPAGAGTLAVTSSSQLYGGAIMASFQSIIELTTEAVTEIAITVATANGTIVHDGGVTITERGTVWGTSSLPTTSSGSKAVVSGTIGSFTASMTGLTSGTVYYVRSYAINADGTYYGNEVTFTTDLVPDDSLYWDINGVEDQEYAVQLYVGGTTGTLTVKLGSTGYSQVIAAGAGTTTLQGVYGGLNGLTFEASATFDGYIDNVYYVLVVGEATIDWDIDTLTNVYPINSSVVFRRIENKDFNRFRVVRYLDVAFKDNDAYVTLLVQKEANEGLTTSTKEFLVSNVSSDTLPFINKKLSTLFKLQAARIGFSNNRLNETFTICQFIIKGLEQAPKTFDNDKIISVG